MVANQYVLLDSMGIVLSAFRSNRKVVMTKIVCSADWHGHLPELPPGDILVIGGDLCPVWDHNRLYQAQWIRSDFIPYLRELHYKDIVVIAGNHDFVFQSSGKLRYLFAENLHYLEDTGATIQGLNFWGTPWSTRFGSWAFMADESFLRLQYLKIPEDTDVLITHGPPFQACDKSKWGNEDIGSKELRARIEKVKPKLVVTGHIHEAYGVDYIGDTIVANVSDRDVDYKPGNPAMVFDI